MGMKRQRGMAFDHNAVARILLRQFGTASSYKLFKAMKAEAASRGFEPDCSRSSADRFCDPDTKSMDEETLTCFARFLKCDIRDFGVIRPNATSDKSVKLLELPEVRSPDGLLQVLDGQSYSHVVMEQIRRSLKIGKHASNLLRLGTKLVLDTWESHPKEAGMISVLLATSRVPWALERRQKKHLIDLCLRALQSDCEPTSKIYWVDPLAFALAKRGSGGPHSRFLKLAICDKGWRTANAELTSRQYYGGQAFEITAIADHLSDSHRKDGLLGAHDLPPLLHLAEQYANQPSDSVRRKLSALMDKSASLLRAANQNDIYESFLKIRQTIEL
jgi:hypothetical protein